MIVHTVAYTKVGGVAKDREACWNTNVMSTRNVAAAVSTVGAKLVHITTDYVFGGQTGGYHEGDTPGPGVDSYSLTELVAARGAYAAARYSLLRISFRLSEFVGPVAFSGLYTKQDYVDIIAPEIALDVINPLNIQDEVLHIVIECKSMHELATCHRPDVQEGTRAQACVMLPGDLSLDTGRWARVKAALNHG